jgi:lipopolysaccharide export system permease protein
MTTAIWRYLMIQVLRTFLPALFCFVLILEFVDLFTNVNRFIANDTAVEDIVRLFVLYIPKAVSYSLSPALLFSATYALAGFYSSNELISILNAGISYRTFIFPLILFGLLISYGSFLFNEHLVIHTFNDKNELTSELLGFSPTADNSQITIKAASKEGDGIYHVYYAGYYRDDRHQIQNLSLFVLEDNSRLTERIDADRAVWNERGYWDFERAAVYSFTPEGIETMFHEELNGPAFTLEPENFQNTIEDISSLRLQDARRLLDRVRLIDFMTYRSYLTDFYERYSFSLKPLIVILFSSVFAWLFKKNILFFSILLSLTVSIFYYVTEMVSILLAKQGYIPPLAGAWLPLVIFGIIGSALLKAVKT